MTLAEVLQIAGWLLTVAGQIQVARKQRLGFITWLAANAVLIALGAMVGLWWCIAMYLTNMAVCLWSFVQWGADASMHPQLHGNAAARHS